uniref:Uncharacterized protein n=1 Tax=Arundo donax TaxID=35708 RepID=A0A0A9AXJ8_ARUDO
MEVVWSVSNHKELKKQWNVILVTSTNKQGFRCSTSLISRLLQITSHLKMK